MELATNVGRDLTVLNRKPRGPGGDIGPPPVIDILLSVTEIRRG